MLRAVLAHLYLAWIHPFGDGNGGTARLIELQILLSAGVPSVSAHLLSNHYNQTRSEYYRQLDRASQSGGDVLPFVEYAVQGLIDGLNEQIGVIDSHQWEATWREFIFDKFKGKDARSAHRQRQLALDLWKVGATGVDRKAVRRLSPELAALYGSKPQRAVDRDLDTLRKMDLIQQTGQTVRVHFLPLMDSHLPRRKR